MTRSDSAKHELLPGDDVEAWNDLTETWAGLFEVAEVGRTGYLLRREADGDVLGHEVTFDHVRGRRTDESPSSRPDADEQPPRSAATGWHDLTEGLAGIFAVSGVTATGYVIRRESVDGHVLSSEVGFSEVRPHQGGAAAPPSF